MFFFTDNTVIMVLPPKGKILKVKEWLKINNQMKEKIKKEERLIKLEKTQIAKGKK